MACTTDYQKGVDDPSYGGPNALANQKQPGSTTDTVKARPGEGGVAPGGATILCVQQGGALLGDAGACAVSFSKDIIPALGASTCATIGCHGGATPPNPPRVDPGDPKAMYAEFAAFKMNGGLAYINPCSTDKTKSGLACNLYATGGCGVHMPSGGQLPQADITKIDTWLACGSPDN
jgi:hypothetical protein